MNKAIIIIIIILIAIIIGVVIFSGYKTPGAVNPGQSASEADSSEPALSGPAIKVDPATFDLGTVVYGDVARHEFTITNTGIEPLEILKLSTSCGCTSAAMAEEDKIIQPGESVPLVVSFDPAVHKDDTDLGELTRVIYIKSNDSANPEVEVTISAFVIKAGEEADRASNRNKSFDIIAKQWEFVPNVIKVKQGDQVKLEITSQDVTHSFALPDFNINERLEPGQETVIEFVADKKGTFSFSCTVFCGAGHSDMKGRLIVD